MWRRLRQVRAWPLAIGLLVGTALAGCLDLRVTDAEAPAVAGLPAGDGWVALPVGLWMTEGAVEALAIAACLEGACPHRAVVGLFRARGGEGTRLASAVRDPAALISSRSRGGRAGADRSRPPAQVTTESRPDGTGFSVRMRSADGRRTVWSEVRLRPTGSHALVLIALGDDAAFVKDVAGRAQASWSAAR